MQIKKIMQLDFEEVFPTIVGDKDWMLSIDDLLDTSHTYIIEELNNISDNINQAEKTDLISFLELMEASEIDIDYDSHVHFQLKRLSEKYPDYMTFRFCEFRYVLNTINNNTDNTQEFLTNFYIKVVDHSLMNLTDFIQESGLGNSLILLNEVNDEIINTVEDACSSYPQKIVLLWITAILYRIQGKYQEAIKYNQQFLEKLHQISREEFDLDFVDDESEVMVCYQLADLNFIHGSIEESLFYCNRVLTMDQDKESSIFYYDTLIIRIRIHMVDNNRAAFSQDYTELLEVITEKELNENYRDILDFRNN